LYRSIEKFRLILWTRPKGLYNCLL
jgi:hypothetical protein